MFCEAKIPAVKRSESPGKKNPKKSPVSAKTINIIPISPTVLIKNIGSSINYLTLLPTGAETSGIRKTGRPSNPSTAMSMPLLS